MVQRIYPSLKDYDKPTQKKAVDMIISACSNSDSNYEPCGCDTNSVSYNISQPVEASNCSKMVTSTVYTKNEIDEKMSKVSKTFEEDLAKAVDRIQTTNDENVHSFKDSIYNLTQKATEARESISWIQIQHYITWVMLAIIGLMIFFKSFNVSVEVNNPVENQEIILEKTNE